MLANDRYGNCVVCAKAHQLRALSTYGEGNQLAVSEKEVIESYFRESGGKDSGLNYGTSLKYWQKNPLGGKTILAAAAVDFRDHVELILSNQLFGGIQVGVNLPQDAISAVNADRDWTSTRFRPDPEAGHAIYLVSTAGDGPTFITWGQKQKASWEWCAKYIEEAYVVLYSGWFQGQSLDPSGVDDASLLEDYRAITGQTPPVPIPVPGPSPVPPLPAPASAVGVRMTFDGGKTCLKPTGWEVVPGGWPPKS